MGPPYTQYDHAALLRKTLTRGLLLQLAVLHDDDAAERAQVQGPLVKLQQPPGATEAHRVDEPAGFTWPKWRPRRQWQARLHLAATYQVAPVGVRSRPTHEALVSAPAKIPTNPAKRPSRRRRSPH